MPTGGKWKLYNSAKFKFGDAVLDLNTHTFKCALFTSSSNADDLTHDELADLTNQVANGVGYTTGGVTLTNVTWTNSNGTITFDFDDPFWNPSGGSISAQYAVVYDDTVAGDPLVCICVMRSTDIVAPDGEELKIIIASTGAFTFSGASTD